MSTRIKTHNETTRNTITRIRNRLEIHKIRAMFNKSCHNCLYFEDCLNNENLRNKLLKEMPKDTGDVFD